MIVALFNGMLGLVFSLFVGTRILNLDFEVVILSAFASNVACLIGILTTLQAEKIQWIREKWLNRTLKSWSLLLAIYLSVLLSLSPELRDWTCFLYMFFPLLLCTGFAIVIFGPIQDALVRKQQRKSLMTQP